MWCFLTKCHWGKMGGKWGLDEREIGLVSIGNSPEKVCVLSFILGSFAAGFFTTTDDDGHDVFALRAEDASHLLLKRQD